MSEIAKNMHYIHAKRKKKDPYTPTQSAHKDGVPLKVFLGCPCKEVIAIIPSYEDRQERRKEFEQETRAAFLQHLVKTEKRALRAAGVSERDLVRMEEGFTPIGFNTHHKVSIFAGGSNEFSNLILIKREPFHDMIHYHVIDQQTRNMQEGEEKKITVPYPPKSVFVPRPEYKFLEKLAKKGHKTYGKHKNMTLQQVEAIAKKNLEKMTSIARGR